MTSGARAWVTLLTNEAYARGVEALWSSLQEVETVYPLIVMATASLPEARREALQNMGMDVRLVNTLTLPAGVGGRPSYACAHFAECWVKLRMWEWTEFRQLCYLDADMLVVKNMDELLDGDLPFAGDPSVGYPRGLVSPADDGGGGCQIAAVQECFGPVAERKARCPYAHADGLAPEAGEVVPPLIYFNAGLLVLRPSLDVFASMVAALAASDLSQFTFAEQDFLNEFFGQRWRPLPWWYNASKALYACHRDTVWDIAQVRNIHYTMAKPWDLKHPCHKGYERLNALWWAAFAEPKTLPRLLLQTRLHEKRRRAQAARGDVAEARRAQPAAARVAAATTTRTTSGNASIASRRGVELSLRELAGSGVLLSIRPRPL